MRASFLALAIAFAGCNGGSPPPSLTTADLMKPSACMSCHPNQFAQWAGSMHAYAADDPVFLAMNARGQRETEGALGTFCVNCHAPMAVKTGATTDGLNLAQLPPEMHGVTCFFCHSVDAVAGDHNNPLMLAADGVMRGGLTNPFPNTAHNAAYSSLHDRQVKDSSSLCGSCHDIVNGHGVALERTYQEWQSTVFAMDTPVILQTCGKCHMSGAEGLAADYPGVPLRKEVHDHTMAAVDSVITEFPGADGPDGGVQSAAIDNLLLTAVQAQLCVSNVENDTPMTVKLDSVAVGHGFPSGATQDRRSWVEVIGYKSGKVIYQSGVVPDGVAIGSMPDPDLWLMRDEILDANGNETHNFWDAVKDVPMLAQLPGAVTNNPADPRYFLHAVTRSFTIVNNIPDRVTARVRIQPIGYEVLDDLIATKDLDPSIRGKIVPLTLEGSVLEWTPTAVPNSPGGYGCVPPM